MPNNSQIKRRREWTEFLESHVGHTMTTKSSKGKLVRVSNDSNFESSNYIGPKIWLDVGGKFLRDFYADEINGCDCQVTFKQWKESNE